MTSLLASLWSNIHPGPHDSDTMNSKMTKRSQPERIMMMEHKNCSGMLFINGKFDAVNIFCVDARTIARDVSGKHWCCKRPDLVNLEAVAALRQSSR